MRSLRLIGDKTVQGINGPFAGNKSMVVNISTDSMIKYSNRIVDIDCILNAQQIIRYSLIDPELLESNTYHR